MAGGGIKGADSLRRTLAEAAEELRHLDPSPAGQLVAARVEAAAPRRTGRLAASTSWVAAGTGFAIEAGGRSAPYAGYVHARNPYIARTFAASLDDVADLYLEAAQGSLDRIRGV